jgi:hypothetical protein
MTLVNRVMAADLVEPGDAAGARAALERAVGYLGIGLEYLGRGERGRAARALETVALERIFRVGVSLTLQLQGLADTLVDKGRVRLGAGLLLDPPYDSLIEGLRQRRPLYALDGPARPFRALADIRRVAAALEEAAQPAALVLDTLHLDPAEIARRVGEAANPAERVRFGTLVRTLAAHLLLDEPPSLAPLDPTQLRAYAALAGAPETRARAEAALRAHAGSTTATLDHWLERWLADLPSADMLALARG